MYTHFLFHSFSLKAPLVDSSDSGHSGTAVIMLVSVVLMGLAVFVIYKFKRYSILDIIVTTHRAQSKVKMCENESSDF